MNFDGKKSGLIVENCTHHIVPSTSKTTPFRVGALNRLSAPGFKGANRRGVLALREAMVDDDRRYGFIKYTDCQSSLVI